MNEQRQNVEDPSQKPETLGESVVLDAIKAEGGMLWYDRAETLEVMRRNSEYCIAQEAALIDTRFGPLIEAAEAVVDRWSKPSVYCDMHTSTLVKELRIAIAKAKGAK